MRIIIKEPKAERHIRVILPYHLFINMAIRKTWFKFGLQQSLKTTEKDTQKIMDYLEYVDFGELRGTLHDISAQKGLVLVEVESQDGTYVKITT